MPIEIRPGDYCWGDRYLPYKVAHVEGDRVVFEGFSLGIARERVLGCARPGEILFMLPFSNNWQPCRVLDAPTLEVELLRSGKVVPVPYTKHLKRNITMDVKAGERFRHYKGKEAEVTEVFSMVGGKKEGDRLACGAIAACDLSDGERCAAYRCGEDEYVRSLSNFTEILAIDGAIFHRFARVS